MSIQAKVSATELVAQVNAQYVGSYFEVALLNSPGTVYSPGVTNETTLINNSELAPGTGGYERQVFRYTSADVGGYSDEGVPLSTKSAIFTHDGTANAITFTHAVLLRGTGNVLTFKAANQVPAAGNVGTYEGVVTSTTGNGVGLTVDVTVTEDAGLYTFAFTPRRFGYGYQEDDLVTISAAAQQAAGVAGSGTIDIILPVGDVTAGGTVVSVAPTNQSVTLSSGNEAVFYFNLKQFGFSGS